MEDVRGGIGRLGVCVLRSDSWMSNLQTQRGQGGEYKGNRVKEKVIGQKGEDVVED